MTTALVTSGVQFPDGSVQTTASTGGSLPAGVVLLWSGSVGNIPVGFALCDGTNGTPDLTDRFIIGAGRSYAPAVIGGSSTITASNLPAHTHNYSGTSSGQSNDHAHGFSGSTGGESNGHSHGVNDPGHSHTIQQNVAGGGGSVQVIATSAQVMTVNGWSNYGMLRNTGSGTGISIGGNNADHSHGFSGSTGGVNAGHTHTYAGTTDGGTGGSAAYLQPYYAMCYIIKL